MRFITTLLTALAFGTSACGQDARTYEHFMAHPDEIQAVLQKCSAQPSDAECAAARKADADLVVQRLSKEADRLAEEERQRVEAQKRRHE